VPIGTHTHAATRRGLKQQDIFESEGVDLGRVIIGHWSYVGYPRSDNWPVYIRSVEFDSSSPLTSTKLNVRTSVRQGPDGTSEVVHLVVHLFTGIGFKSADRPDGSPYLNWENSTD
jgi:Phosphotriesterase family